MFQSQLRTMAQDRRLKGAHWRVLAYLIGGVTFAQDMLIKQKEVAEALGMTPQALSKYLRDLGHLGIVGRVATGEYPPTYRFNSLYVYKGRGERLRQRLAHQRKERARD